VTVRAILLHVARALSPLTLLLGRDQTLHLLRKHPIAPFQLTDLVLPGAGLGRLKLIKEIIVGCEGQILFADSEAVLSSMRHGGTISAHELRMRTRAMGAFGEHARRTHGTVQSAGVWCQVGCRLDHR
jgi:hypothetical protein